jgi:tRNA-specific 2-thiouridylase
LHHKNPRFHHDNSTLPPQKHHVFTTHSGINSAASKLNRVSANSIPQETIAVAMSGGVDSSTVAALLHAQGRNIIGLTLQLWDQRRLGHSGEAHPAGGRCCSIDDVYDARAIAAQLGIPYYLVNQQERFERDVVRPFVNEYLAGRTPIPCTHCNDSLKFDALLETSRAIGASRIATGHYARIQFCERRNRWLLLRAADADRDQTYFLFGLTQPQLAHTIFPLGDMLKPDVRRFAAAHGMPDRLAQKPDSQEICFIPDGDYKHFIDSYLAEQHQPTPQTSGSILDSENHVLGPHPGIQHFTVGQRKGLNLSSKEPLYVIDINPATHSVTAGPESDLYRCNARVENVNWISIPALTEPLHVTAKIRHRHAAAPATISPAPDGAVELRFDSPQRAITPGQAAVFYQDAEVVGGGWIQ